jgi:hypothetical protein
MAEKFTNKLLIEAIADAELVKKTAIENAKLSLEETFTPHIKSMLSRRLRAEAEGMESDDEEKDVEMKEKEPEEKETEVKEEGATEKPLEDAEAEHSSATPQSSSDIGAGDNKEPSAEAEATSDIDQGGEGHTDSETDWYDDWSESDFDLDEVIAELEGELQEMAGESEEEEEVHETWNEEAEKAPESDEDGGKEKTDAMIKHTEKEAVEPHAAADVNKFVADPSVPTMEMGGEEHGEEEKLNLEELLAELEAADAEEEEKSAKIASLEKELKEYQAALRMVKDRLMEVNLLNAKLLYTNKIFRKDGLTTEQKVSIVENFDRASSVREVKMVYTVLVETLTTAAKTVKTTKSPKKIVTEGFASKATPSTAPKAEPTEILAENSVAKRLQQLAGII